MPHPIARGVIDPITGKAGYKDVFTQERFKEDLLAAGISEQAGNLFYQNSFLVPFGRSAFQPAEHGHFPGPQLQGACCLS